MLSRRFSTAALAIVLMLIGGATVAQDDLGKEELEVAKLKLEIAKLEREVDGLTTWVPAFLGIIGGFVAAAGSIWVAYRTRRGSLDQSVHEKRLESYPKLVAAGAPLALYFPSETAPNIVVDKLICGEMGNSMREWYLTGGGILLSEEARDVYFLFALALTRAMNSPGDLDVPKISDYAEAIDSFSVGRYKGELGIPRVWHDKTWRQRGGEQFIRKWQFGAGKRDNAADRFRDYVLLQALGSALRTSLTRDLNSRRRPS
jgi:hypothetical protein